HQIVALGRLELEGVHEISVQAGGPDRNAVEQRVRLRRTEGVPTHMRDLQARVGGRDAVDLARNPTEAFRHLIFAPTPGHELHADADTEEWPALLAHAHIERVRHTGDRVKPTPAVRECTHAR